MLSLGCCGEGIFEEMKHGGRQRSDVFMCHAFGVFHWYRTVEGIINASFSKHLSLKYQYSKWIAFPPDVCVTQNAIRLFRSKIKYSN